MFAFLVALAVLLFAVVVIGLISMVWKAYSQKARNGGYGSVCEYLRAAPRSEKEKQEAVDLALQGLIICVLGLLFPPFLLLGVVPLYFGARKIAYSSMGLGLFEDGDPPKA